MSSRPRPHSSANNFCFLYPTKLCRGKPLLTVDGSLLKVPPNPATFMNPTIRARLAVLHDQLQKEEDLRKVLQLVVEVLCIFEESYDKRDVDHRRIAPPLVPFAHRW